MKCTDASENQQSAYAKPKAQISCAVTASDQRLCFCYSDSIIPLPLKSEISSFWPSPVTVQAGLCQTWSEPQTVGFLMQKPQKTNYKPPPS